MQMGKAFQDYKTAKTILELQNWQNVILYLFNNKVCFNDALINKSINK